MPDKFNIYDDYGRQIGEVRRDYGAELTDQFAYWVIGLASKLFLFILFGLFLFAWWLLKLIWTKPAVGLPLLLLLVSLGLGVFLLSDIDSVKMYSDPFKDAVLQQPFVQRILGKVPNAKQAGALPSSTQTPQSAGDTSRSISSTAKQTISPAANPTRKPTVTPVHLNGVVTANRLNIREGPGISHNVVGVLLRDNKVVASGRNAEGDWVRIIYQDEIAWIASEFVSFEESVERLPVATP